MGGGIDANPKNNQVVVALVQKLGIAPLHPAGPAGSNEVSFVFNGAKEVLEARKTCAKTRV